MYKNLGFIKEEEFPMHLNGRKYIDLNKNLKFMIRNLFDHVNDNDLITCRLVEGSQKADFEVIINGEVKRVSLKSGRADVIHSEYFQTLIPFFRSINMDEGCIDFLLRYCYADGSNDGTGIDRYSFPELLTIFAKETKRFNEIMMRDKEMIKKIIDRFMFAGSEAQTVPADFIYHGSVEYGFLCSKRQIFRHIDRRDWAYMDSPHIGPLLFRAHYRGKTDGSKRDKRRHQCDIRWANLGADIEYISERYDG